MSALQATGAHELLAQVFGARELEREYPLVLAPLATNTLVEVEVEGQVRAACAVLVRNFRLGARTLRGGLIGSVATHADWRRQGLATRVLERAEAELRARGCVFALLWADDPRFYLARGYAPFGSECDALLVSELAPVLPTVSGVRELEEHDVPHLVRLHERHPARVERTLDEAKALFRVPGMLTLVRERVAAPGHPPLPVAYASLGRGRDLKDAIHDWAGEAEDVLVLLRAHLERRFPQGEPGALFLMAPLAASELLYRLVALGAPLRRGILGLGKVLDESAASACVSAVLGARGSADWSGSELTVHGPEGCATLDREGLHALLFGAPEVAHEVRALLERIGLPDARLPLELFAFGLDSI